MRKSLALGTAVLSLAGLAATAAPASASTVDTTFTVAAGTLSLASAATTASLGTSTSNALGTTVTGALPKVTVTDDRASIAGWTSQVSSTDFTATVSGAVKTIAASKGKAYVPVGNGPTVLSAVGSITAATTAIDPATGIVLSGTAQTLVTGTLATGSNKVEYTPVVQVTIDGTVVAATYAGKITHTVV